MCCRAPRLASGHSGLGNAEVLEAGRVQSAIATMPRFPEHLGLRSRACGDDGLPGAPWSGTFCRQYANLVHEKERLNRAALWVRIVFCSPSVWHDQCRDGDVDPFVAVDLPRNMVVAFASPSWAQAE